MIPNLFINDSDNAEISQHEKDFKKELLDDMRETSFVIPAIFVRIEAYAYSVVFLNQAKIFFNFEEGTWTHGVLDLLHASNTFQLAR